MATSYPTLKPRKDEDPIYGAGKRARGAFNQAATTAKNVAARTAFEVTKPILAPGAIGATFASGFLGGTDPAAQPAAAPVRPATARDINPRSGQPFNRAPAVAGAAAPPVTLQPLAVSPNPLTPLADPNREIVDPVIAAPSTAPQVREIQGRAQDATRRATLQARGDAGNILNPMSNEAELLRRIENVSISSALKGSPSARAAAMGALGSQLAAGTAASAQGQDAATDLLRDSAEAEAGALEGAALRQQDAQVATLNARGDARSRQNALLTPQQLVRDVGTGQTSILRADGTAATLRNEAGQPIQTPAAVDPNAIGAKDLFEARNAEIKAVMENTLLKPEDRDAAVAAINSRPEYANLVPQAGAGAGQPPPAAVDYLKANPTQAAAFDAKYGPGAAARFLQQR